MQQANKPTNPPTNNSYCSVMGKLDVSVLCCCLSLGKLLTSLSLRFLNWVLREIFICCWNEGECNRNKERWWWSVALWCDLRLHVTWIFLLKQFVRYNLCFWKLTLDWWFSSFTCTKNHLVICWNTEFLIPDFCGAQQFAFIPSLWCFGCYGWFWHIGALLEDMEVRKRPCKIVRDEGSD